MPPLRCGVACDADRHNHEWLTPLYNSPEIAAPLLQRLDAQGNIHGKYMLVDDLHVLLRNDALTDGHHEQFFKSGVLSTLLQMLLYDHSYATYEYPIPPQVCQSHKVLYHILNRQLLAFHCSAIHRCYNVLRNLAGR